MFFARHAKQLLRAPTSLIPRQNLKFFGGRLMCTCSGDSAQDFYNDEASPAPNVIARHIAHSINTAALHETLYRNTSNDALLTKKRIVLTPQLLDTGSQDSYAVVYKYGSVVYFNCEENIQQQLEDTMKPFCTADTKVSVPREAAVVRLDSELKSWSSFDHDILALRKLDLRNVSVVAGVLGQTVALEYYERKVDDILEEFRVMNDDVVRTGGTFNMEKRKLFQLIANNNRIVSEVIAPSSLALLDSARPGGHAWEEEKYDEIQTSLREEYELEQRFQSLEFKLNMIQTHTQFFVDALNTRYGERQTWAIIGLIVVEILIAAASHVVH